jgi:hypothetical protein
LRFFGLADAGSRGVSFSLIACMRLCAREEFEFKDDHKVIAASGGRLTAILDFEFLSRPRAAMQTMRGSALGYSPSQVENAISARRDLGEVQK